MELWETRVEIPPQAAEPVELALLESGFGGWSLLEDALAKRAWIVGIFHDRAEADSRWKELRPALPSEILGESVPRPLPDADWKNSYREHFRAWTFGRLHWFPVWERESFLLPAGHSVLWLDPGLAFGTGNHETTRLCVERLVEFEASLAAGPVLPGALRVVDAGCGSGILALSASLLGFGDVRGFDNDPEAVRVSFENAELNAMAARVGFSTAGLPEGLSDGPSDVLMANIQADILVRHRADLVGAVAPGGILVLSGILASEAGSVRDAFAEAAPGWAADSRVLGEWCDLCLRRPSG
jgi:ribosomal protein L11 methyltransferase